MRLFAFLLLALAVTGCPKPDTETRGPNLTPEGTFILLKQVPFPTREGIVDIQPGTRVTLVGRDGSRPVVTDGQHQFAVYNEWLTNNADGTQDPAPQPPQAVPDVPPPFIHYSQGGGYDRTQAFPNGAATRYLYVPAPATPPPTPTPMPTPLPGFIMRSH